MFRNACTIAREFTQPVILCRQAVNGICSSSIGSFVVVNDGGWIVTAGHIVDQLQKLVLEETATKGHPAALAAIVADNALTKKQKYDQTRALGKPSADSTQQAGVKWGYSDANLVDASRHPHMDLAVGRLDPFDPASVSTYPTFKDPGKDFEPGAFLCKYGFPFHSVVPTWDDVAGKFQVGNNPLPLFPIEGIFTREVEIVVPGTYRHTHYGILKRRRRGYGGKVEGRRSTCTVRYGVYKRRRTTTRWALTRRSLGVRMVSRNINF